MNPLLPLRPLAADVKHVKGHLLHLKFDHDNSRRLDTGPEHVLVVGIIFGVAEPVDVREEVFCRVVELKLVPSQEDALDGIGRPQVQDAPADLFRRACVAIVVAELAHLCLKKIFAL